MPPVYWAWYHGYTHTRTLVLFSQALQTGPAWDGIVRVPASWEREMYKKIHEKS
jgi:hypothetical protein